jgi:hypothetical protein
MKSNCLITKLTRNSREIGKHECTITINDHDMINIKIPDKNLIVSINYSDVKEIESSK